MDIFFQSKKLEKIASDPRKCLKEDVRYLPGHYHELKRDRKGQWGCDLDQPYRLIFEPHEDPVPTDDNGRYIWIEIKGVEIVEIVNYHGK